MKKSFCLLFLSSILAASTVLLSSCENSKGDTRIHLDFGEIKANDISNITELPELKYNGLTSKISHGDSFLLAIYNEGCGCWTDFQPVLTEFFNETHTTVEYINVYEFTGKDDLGLYLEVSDLPSLAVYEQGQLKIQSVYLRDDRMMFKSYTKFKEFIDNNVVLPKMYYINKDVLDSIITENKEFNLYIARNACGDCNAVTTEVLYDWSKNTGDVSDILYVFDIQSYYPIKGEDDYDTKLVTYQYIKDYYGLSEKNNPTFGYSTGMVPTFQRRKGMEILDMIVVLNDSLDKANKKVTSYFTEERVSHMKFLEGSTLNKTILDGFELNDDQVANWRIYRSQFNATYHYPIVREFFKAYVK